MFSARPKIITVGSYKHIAVRPLSGLIGAEIEGVDLNEITPEQSKEIHCAFADHLVIVFRRQGTLTHENHVRFATSFGPIQPIPHLKGIDGFPDIQLIHRDADDKNDVIGEAFHCDSTFLKTPPRAVVMRAAVLPPYGGDTAFGNLYLAYETLSPKMREVLDSLRVVHSAKRLFGSQAEGRTTPKEMDKKEGDLEVVHPLVVTHPVTGRRSIFTNPLFSIQFEGMTQEESAPIFKFLYEHATFTPLTVRVRWEPGTVLVWDNWAASHSAVGD